MTLDELYSADPTESEHLSARIVQEILRRNDWRCYSSKVYYGTLSLIERFLRSHARLTGLVTDEIYADLPGAILHFETDQGHITRGALFKNGAVLISRAPAEQRIYALFIDDTTANTWGYPDQGFVYTPEYERQILLQQEK